MSASEKIHLSICNERPDAAKESQVLKAWAGSVDDLAELFSKAVVGDKLGPYFVRGPFSISRRSDENISRADVLVIDGDKRIDRDTGEIQSGAPSPMWAHEALQQLGLPHFIYTSHSHDPAHQFYRWRAVIPCPIMTHPELLAMADHVVSEMNRVGCFVANATENGNWSQPWFLPRIRSADAPFEFFDGTDADPITREQVIQITAAWEAENAKHRPTQKPYEGRSSPDDISTPIGRYNAAYGQPEQIIDLLEKHGYLFVKHDRLNDQTSYRCIRAGSESGVPGVHVYPGIGNGKWLTFCHHAGDPLDKRDSEGRQIALDAFELFTQLEHGGDKEKAVVAAMELFKKEYAKAAYEDDQDKPFIDSGSALSEIQIDDILAASPPLIQRYVEYAMAGSAFQVKPWAFCGALAFIAQGTARHWYGPTDLSTSLLQAIMGPTESGKDKIVVDPLSALLATADRQWKPRTDQITPPRFMNRVLNRIASGKALEARLEEYPATTFICNEMGGMFARMNGKKPDSLMESLKELLLSTFGKDNQVISEKVFAATGLSKSQKEALSSQIVRPCLSVIGLMTDEQAKSFDRVTVKDGLLNRFILVPSPRLAFNPISTRPEIDGSLVEWLLRCHVIQEKQKDQPVTVPWGKGAEALYLEVGKAVHESIDEQPLNHRFTMKLLKLALCFALARDIESPTINVGDIELAKLWLERANDAALRAILLAGGMSNGDHHSDLITLAMELQAEGESGYKPLSRVFHHRNSKDREEIVRSAVQIGLADVTNKVGTNENDLVMQSRGLPRGLRIIPRMNGIRQFLAAAGRA